MVLQQYRAWSASTDVKTSMALYWCTFSSSRIRVNDEVIVVLQEYAERIIEEEERSDSKLVPKFDMRDAVEVSLNIILS